MMSTPLLPVPLPHKRDVRLAVLLLLVICVSLASLTAWKIWAARQRALNEVQVHSLNLTQALDTYAEGIIRQSSMMLLGLSERLEVDGGGPQQLARLAGLVEEQNELLTQLHGLTVYGPTGEWLMSTNGPIPDGANSADREFFIHHRDNPSREVFIGPPIRSRSTQDWVITVSRRFEQPGGQFAGVIAVTLGVENFLRLFGKIDVGKDGAIALTYTSGRILVRYPFREQDMGRDFSRSPIYTRYLVENSVGTASFASSLDGVERLYAFRKNEHLPLVTTVAIGKREALDAWRMEAWLTVGLVLALQGVIAVIGRLLIRDMRHRAEMDAQLLVAREELLATNRQLAVLATHDTLTGLANRRRFDEVLASEVRRAQREAQPLALLLIDIDHFKRFNDAYGHIGGDECLKAVSALLRECVRRPTDVVARYGGEELAMVLPNTEVAGAVVVAETVLARLAELNIVHAGSPFGRVSVSIGVAGMAGQGETPLTLVAAADQALYAAKAAGRNRCVVFEGGGAAHRGSSPLPQG